MLIINFLMVDIGDSGHESDGSVFASCNIGQAIKERRLNLPEGRVLGGTSRLFRLFRFRLFRRPIIGTVDNVILATKAIVALHNYLMADHKFYFPPSFGDLSIGGTVRPGDWRNDVSCQNGLRNLSKIGSNNYTNDAKTVRDNFCRYFSSDVGAVPWQFYAVNNTLVDFDRQ